MASIASVGVGETVKLWDAYATPAVDTYTESVFVPQTAKGARSIVIAYKFGTAPTSVTLTVEQSDDNVTFTSIGTLTNELRDQQVYTTQNFVRVYITAIAGSPASLTLQITLGLLPSYSEADGLNPESLGNLVKTLSTKGGHSPFGEKWEVSTLSGAGGFRQSALQILVTRDSGQSVTWDGNPDCCIKLIARNNAANASNEGAAQGINIQARNGGTNASWVEAISANVRNDSGKTINTMTGIRIRVEDYGTISTEAVGIDVNMSIEGAAPLKYGIRIRNTDASGMSAVTAALHISATATNGIGAFVEFDQDDADTCITAGGAGTPTAPASQWRQVKILIGTTPYYFPVSASVWTNA
jgi:hypothetical protein